MGVGEGDTVEQKKDPQALSSGLPEPLPASHPCPICLDVSSWPLVAPTLIPSAGLRPNQTFAGICQLPPPQAPRDVLLLFPQSFPFFSIIGLSTFTIVHLFLSRAFFGGSPLYYKPHESWDHTCVFHGYILSTKHRIQGRTRSRG